MLWKTCVSKMFPSILSDAFESFRSQHPSQVQHCLSIQSMWKKPTHYTYDAYYIPETKQLVWTGYLVRYDTTIFQLYENADTMLVRDLLIDIADLLYDESDLILCYTNEEEKEEETEDPRLTFLNTPICTLHSVDVLINN